MSYDLLVFEPSAVPAEPEAFKAWYEGFMRWDGAWNYNDPAVCSRSLQRWEAGMRQRFGAQWSVQVAARAMVEAR